MSLSHHITSFCVASKDNINNQSPQGLMAGEQLIFPHNVPIYFITSYHLSNALLQFNYIWRNELNDTKDMEYVIYMYFSLLTRTLVKTGQN